MKAEILQQVSALAVDEQIDLIEAMWDGLAARVAALPLTEAQMSELDRRLADHAARPDDTEDWAAVKAAVQRRLGQ